ncbi:MAG: M48 family metallopeptidase [Peptococcaceae bacterium]|nr:M48 family metallopeptidase [Peptococcaceae bacterium]
MKQTGKSIPLWGKLHTLDAPVENLKEWYRPILKAKIAELLPALEAQTGLYCSEWRVKDMKTRWGSCNITKKRIWLNLKLVQYPPECLEYVILHELIHLKVPNHSADFYAELDQYMPDWQMRRKILNRKIMPSLYNANTNQS